MRVIEISQYGAPEVLRPAYIPQPIPGIGQVLIRVSAAGVNRPDCIQRAGFYPPPAGASPIPGLEVSGEIIAIGDESGRFGVGDKVCALLTGGGYAEYAVAEQSLCLPIPEQSSLIEAAGLPETFFTVWSNLFDRAGLQAGESLLIRGGAGGIGSSAIQIAANLGVGVMVTAGSEEKCQLCLALGAGHAINYRSEQDLVARVLSFTGGRGADVILDMVGGDAIAEHMACAAEDGRIVSIGFLTGSRVTLDLMPIMLKRLTLTGSTLRPRPVDFKAAIAAQLEANVWPLLAAGKVKPHVHAQLPLEQAAEAHRMMEAGEHAGKILLVP